MLLFGLVPAHYNIPHPKYSTKDQYL